MVTLQGFGAEGHAVISHDGYITQLTRVVNPKANKTQRGKPVAVHHGLMQSPKSALLAFGYLPASQPQTPPSAPGGQNNTDDNTLVSIAYYLSNQGYDVWLIEARGSTSESRRHLNTSITSSDYWNFRLDEQSHYDLPAQINYILNSTGYSSYLVFFPVSTS